MTAEEKAKELVEKFMPSASGHRRGYKGQWVYDYTVHVANAKACALICVEEIINSIPAGDFEAMGYNPQDDLEYWQSVKQHLQNL